MQNLSVRQHFGIHFFISLYLFNTATDQVYFWHACTLGPGLYSPNVFGDAALINYANLCKICQSVNILVYTFLHFGIHFFIIGLYLFNTATDRVYFWHACTLGPGLYSPECIDRESCDTLVKGHPKEFHVIVNHERVPQNSSNLFVHDLQKLVFSSAKIIPEITPFCCPKDA